MLSPSEVATGLILCESSAISTMLIDAFRAVAISSDRCEELHDFLVLLSCRRYEVVCTDFSMGEEAVQAVSAVRSGRSNRTAISIAITDDTEQSSQALSSGIHFVIQQPLSPQSIHGIIRAAYGLIIRERRRYFRCPVDVRVIAHRRTEGAWVGHASNVSERGMCMTAPVRLIPGEVLELRFTLPSSGAEISVEGEVQWSDSSRRVGLRFVRVCQASQSDLQHWLMHEQDKVLRPALASLSDEGSFVSKLCASL